MDYLKDIFSKPTGGCFSLTYNSLCTKITASDLSIRIFKKLIENKFNSNIPCWPLNIYLDIISSFTREFFLQ